MPTYTVRCKCGRKRDVICKPSDRLKQTCECGNHMVVVPPAVPRIWRNKP